MCYKRIMREWVREKLMRRRKKPATNDSESTGKIGHEIPQGQPTPLQPSYPQSPEAEGVGNVRARDRESSEDTHSASGERGAPKTGAEARNRHTGRGGGKTESRQEPVPEQRGRESSATLSSGREDASGATEPQLVIETQPESLAQPPAAPETAKTPKGYVVLAIGLPGSGKTTWFKRRGVTPLSSDMLRGILFDDISEQRYQGLVFSTLRSLLRARLIAKMPWNYVDATNLSPHERRQWIKMARSFGYEVQAVFFDVPFEVCMERNSRRDRMLNEESMRKMAERLRPPSFKEGFHKITVVRVKNSPGPATEDFDPQG
jgi:predicted kinase